MTRTDSEIWFQEWGFGRHSRRIRQQDEWNLYYAGARETLRVSTVMTVMRPEGRPALYRKVMALAHAGDEDARVAVRIIREHNWPEYLAMVAAQEEDQ